LWGISFLPTKVVYVNRLHMNARGLALPGLVLLKEGEPMESLNHELTHILQYRRYSPFGVSLILGWHYGVGFLRQWHQKQPFCFWSLWSTNPLEQEANERMYAQSSPLQFNIRDFLLFLLSAITIGLIFFI
jgi:hypothetical protein